METNEKVKRKREGLALMLTLVVVSLVTTMSLAYPTGDVLLAEYVRTIDGDTIVVHIPEWPDLVGDNLPIRIVGIDTEELKDPNLAVRRVAEEQKALVERVFERTSLIRLVKPKRDKYFRLAADVELPRDMAESFKVETLSELMLMLGARPYDEK